MSKGLTSTEAAARLGVSTARVRRLVLDGRLPAEKFGRDLVIQESDLESFERLKGGRPPKAATKADGGASTGEAKAGRKALSRWENEGGSTPKGKKKSGKK
jgi:excisionase family DNA binding protein